MRRGHAALLTAAVVVALTGLGIWQVRPPEAAGTAAPAAAFSATRALRHLTTIAAEPHPYASAANTRVRDILVAGLRQTGLTAWVQHAVVVPEKDRHVYAAVDNVLAVLAGTGKGRAVLLVAHYDSVAVSPGAADNATSVATLLEVARALRSGPALERDVLILFTDAEECGLLGVQAFLRSPWARRVGLALNFDNPGSSGPSIMYETSPGNEALVRAFAGGAPLPFASSLTDDVARRRWVENDFSPLRAAGLPGMTFGFTEGFFRNHSMLDTVAHIDPGSLQHQGDYALSLTRAFASGASVESSATETVYFNPVRGVLVVYGRGWAVPLALAAVGLFAAVVAVGLRRRRLSPFGLLGGTVNGLLSLVFMAALTALVWALVHQVYGVGTSTLPFYNDDVHRAGLVALVLAIGLTVHLWGVDQARILDTTTAALLWWVALGAYVACAFPGASYLLVWPALAALSALGVTLFLPPLVRADGRVSAAPLVAFLAGAAPGVLLASSSLYLLFVASGVRLAAVVVCVWLLLGLLAPHVAVVCAPRRWPLPVALAVVGAGLFLGLSPATGYGDDWPQPDSLLVRVDHSSGETAWGTQDGAEDAWTGRAMGAPERWADTHEHAPLWGFVHYQRAAGRGLSAEPPRLEILEDVESGGRRALTLRLWSPDAAPFVSLLLHSEAGVVTASVDETPVAGWDTAFLDYSATRWHVDVLGMPRGGVTVRLTTDGGVRLNFRVVELRYGLPAEALARIGVRPDGFVPGGLGDATIVSCDYVVGRRAGGGIRRLFSPAVAAGRLRAMGETAGGEAR